MSDKEEKVEEFKGEEAALEAEKEVNEPTKEEQLRLEMDLLKDKYLRIVAEMENMKKRMVSEREQMVYNVISSFSRDILGVADNLSRALQNVVVSPENKALIEGIEMTQKVFLDALLKNGITEIEAKPGDEVDPKLHRVISEVETDTVAPGKIAEVLQKGFLLMGKPLREAMVITAKNK